jgi:hypothetical protein
MIHKLMLGTALCVALGLALGAETASAKAGDASAQRVCRLAAAAPPLKLLDFTAFVEGLGAPAERMTRRANYTPVPGAGNARERASLLVSLERQPKPASLMVGVGF